MEQEVLDRYSISKEGVILSQLILSYMNDEFTTNLPEESSIVNDLPASEEVFNCLDSFGRGDNVKTNKCIQYGIIDYITYYTTVELQSFGIAVAVPPNTMNIVVDDEYGLIHNGIVAVNKEMNELFTTFSLGRLMGELDITSDYIEELFKDIVHWLGFNLSPSKAYKLNNITIDSFGFINETYVHGKGTVLFKDKRSDIKNHISNINDRLSILNSDNIDNFNDKHEWIEYFFEATWGIICTSIVEFLNNNTVTTGDDGYSFYGGTIMPYEGVSESKVEFTDTYQQPVSIDVIDVLGVKIKNTFKIKIPEIHIVISMKDRNGNTKEFVINITIEGISLDMSDMPNVMKLLNDKLNEITDKIKKEVADRSARLGRTYEQILDDVNKVTEKMTEVVNTLTDAITEEINKLLDSISILLKRMTVRISRKLAWDPFLNSPDPNISGPANIYYNTKEAINTATSKINGTIEISNNYIKNISNIKDINDAIKEFNDAINEVNDIVEKLGPDFCVDILIPAIPPLLTIPELTIPEPPEIPELPEGDFPNVPSDEISFDENGDLEGEVPIVSEAVDGIVDPLIPEVEIPKLNPPMPTLPEVIEFSYPPTTSPDVGYNDEKYDDVNIYTTSESMKNDIKSYEQIAFKLFKDLDNKHADLGYGHVVGLWKDRASLQQTNTLEEADMWFEEDVRKAEVAVKKYVRQKITQGQFDSFVDLVYNAGSGRFKNSTILSWFNQGRICDTSNLYRRCFITSDGEVLRGLIRRRGTGYTYFIKDWGVSGCVPY